MNQENGNVDELFFVMPPDSYDEEPRVVVGERAGDVQIMELYASPALRDKALAAIAGMKNWWDLWEALCDNGLKHPKHGQWNQDMGDGTCLQYICAGYSPYFGSTALSTCQLPPGHDGPHQREQIDGSVLEWTDDEADKVNHRYWKKASTVWDAWKDIED